MLVVVYCYWLVLVSQSQHDDQHASTNMILMVPYAINVQSLTLHHHQHQKCPVPDTPSSSTPTIQTYSGGHSWYLNDLWWCLMPFMSSPWLDTLPPSHTTVIKENFQTWHSHQQCLPPPTPTTITPTPMHYLCYCQQQQGLFPLYAITAPPPTNHHSNNG